VRQYLELLDRLGEKAVNWTLVENERGTKNKVAFGLDRAVIAGFYFYRRI
jgi:hypothetical protein